MIYFIGDKKLDIPEMGSSRKFRTPRQVVPYRDVAETCRTIDALLPEIDFSKNKAVRIIDGVARSGFWGAVFLTRWPLCKLTLNEADESCLDILKNNFPECTIKSENIETWTPPKSDILLLDFDDFTLKKSEKHKKILARISKTTKYLMVADNTCFGFKFGNMKHYGVETEEEYYKLLNREMKPYLNGKRMVAVSAFINAAMILYADVKGRNIKHIPPSNLFISRGGKPYKYSVEKDQGLGICG